VDIDAREIEAALQALPDQRAASLRTLRRSLSRRLSASAPREVIDLATELVASGDWAQRFLAYEIVLHHRAALASVNERVAQSLGAGIADWAAVDTFACYVAGPAWRERQISDASVRRWAASTDRWWRRAAIVCTVALNNRARGGAGDAARTLDICTLVIDDRDDMVVKALSWALRELSKRDANAVKSFVTKYRARLAPRVVREVGNKLSTGLKTPSLGRARATHPIRRSESR
jgi:3-methyladenine DNA glycosylase AlkD